MACRRSSRSSRCARASHPEYYWFDPGVARAAAGLLDGPVDAAWLGQALETLVFHELRVYNHTANRHETTFSFYRTEAGLEVDFIVEQERQTASRKAKIVCVEVNSSRKWDRRWETAMRGMAASGQLRIDRMVGVYLGDTAYHFDGIDVLPLRQFLGDLPAGRIFLGRQVGADNHESLTGVAVPCLLSGGL